MTTDDPAPVAPATFNAFIGNALPPRDVEPSSHVLIAEVTQHERALAVAWAGGGESRYPHRWLRFNCFCRGCGSSNDGIRMIDLTQIPADISAAEVTHDGDGISIEWPDGHTSRYGADWLHDHSMADTDRRRRRRWRPTLWRATPWSGMPRAEYDEIVADETARLEMFEALRDHGLVRIDGVGQVVERTAEVASIFGPIHETTLYGQVNDVESKPVAKLGGETAIHQLPHCDDVFHYSPPGMVLFHFITNDIAEGGVSSYVDGFAVAEALRDEAPEAFELLTTVPVQFIRRRPGFFDLRGEGRVIRLDADGRVAGIRYFDRSTAPLDVDEDLVDAMLDAQTEFMRRVVSPEFQVNQRLEPGDVVVVDNHRVMHGRTSFDPILPRRLRTATVDRDEFHARWRELAFRLGRDDHDMIMSSGAV